MTEYTTSPEAYKEYMTAHERTVYWVQAHSSDPNGFYSPSVPPSEMEGFIPSSPPSDAGSSHSLPPKMVLRYNDGRPDIPIPRLKVPGFSHGRSPSNHGSYGHPRPSGYQRSHTTHSGQNHRPPSPIAIHPPSQHSTRRGGAGSSSQPVAILGPTSASPEEIRVLPSRAPSSQRPIAHVSHRQGSHHSRSRSLPRTVADPDRLVDGAAMGTVPVASPTSRPIGYPPLSFHHSHGVPQANFVPQAGPGPWNAMQTSSGSGSHGSRGHSGRKVPPAIVYAPSHHGHFPQYAPPPIYYHPPQRGPDGMIYSHSAPVPLEGGAYPAPTAMNYHHGERGRRERTRSLEPGLVHKTQRSDGGEVSDPESAGSGSTYYVLPAAGQKVHVIAPSPDQSVHTATSTTKSPGTSPHKPFFQKIFGFAKFGSSNTGSTRGPRRKLERRHSVGANSRPSAIPIDPLPQ